MDALSTGPDGPSAEELAAIEEELPLIEAEVLLVDAEIRVLNAYPHPSELDWRRLRHAQHRVTCELAAWLALLDRTANRRAA
jgi:uncharacterized protein DUF6284